MGKKKKITVQNLRIRLVGLKDYVTATALRKGGGKGEKELFASRMTAADPGDWIAGGRHRREREKSSRGKRDRGMAQEGEGGSCCDEKRYCFFC